MEIPYISSAVSCAADVKEVFNALRVPSYPINCVNWPDLYPYCPEVSVRAAYGPQGLLLDYKVKENSLRAKYSCDNDSVWTDACVEFFCSFDDDGIYYNLETNCIGTVLLGVGSGRDNRERAAIEVTESIQRWASLGRRPIEERVGEVCWQLSLIVPYSAFYKHRIVNLRDHKVRFNFYKCGDELPTPHYVSMNPIGQSKPDFHVPQFFKELVCK